MPTNVFYNGFSSALFNTVNVLAYGAVGDGVADDTIAIQAALDALKITGGTIHFPVGIYRLTKSVHFYSNQELIFEQGATLLQGAEINNLMMNYSTADTGGYNATQNVVIEGAIFDGGSYTTENTLLGFCHSKDITVRNCKFVNGYGTWHNIEVNSSKNVLIDRCWLSGNRRTGENGELIQIDSFNNTATWPWGNGKVDGTVSYMVEVKNCWFGNCAISPAIGNHSDAVVDCIRVHDNVFEGFTSSRGAINFKNARNVDVYNNTFVNGSTGIIISTADNTNTVHDNRFISVATVCGSGINTYNNMIDGKHSHIVGGTAAAHTHSASDLVGIGYLGCHPEEQSTIIPFLYNDLAHLTKKGGSCKVYKTNSTDFTVDVLNEQPISVDHNCLFSGTPDYVYLGDLTADIPVVIDLSLHKLFTYGNKFYIDFGNTWWGPQNVEVYCKSENGDYVLFDEYHGDYLRNWHTNLNVGTPGFDKLRIVLRCFQAEGNTVGRIAEIGLIEYCSSGAKETFISRGGCEGIYGGLTPHYNSSIDLGTSEKHWKTVYADKIVGALPAITAADAGKFLRVAADGTIVTDTIMMAEEVTF